MTPPPERQSNPGTEIGSFLLSLLFHLFIALLLWCLVIKVTKSESIFLLGSTTKTDEVTVTLDVSAPETNSADVAEQTKELISQEKSNASIDALIADAMRPNTLASPGKPNDELPSIDFFGTRAYGNRFVFVLDISYSMNARQGERFRRACDELIRAISQLQAGQSYYVFLFCWHLDEMFHEREVEYVPVGAGRQKQLRNWIYDVSLGPGTDPRRALSLARRMNPDAVFLLSDGQFNQPRVPLSESGWLDDREERIDIGVQEGVERFYEQIPIHTIAFENPFTQSAMAAISRASGGRFRYVKTQSLEPVDPQRFLTSLRQIERKHRHETDPTREYQTRLSMARELICDGELLYAEYIMRPLYRASPSKILNPTLLDELRTVLDSEVGDARLEDYQQPPEFAQILAEGT